MEGDHVEALLVLADDLRRAFVDGVRQAMLACRPERETENKARLRATIHCWHGVS